MIEVGGKWGSFTAFISIYYNTIWDNAYAVFHYCIRIIIPHLLHTLHYCFPLMHALKNHDTLTIHKKVMANFLISYTNNKSLSKCWRNSRDYQISNLISRKILSTPSSIWWQSCYHFSKVMTSIDGVVWERSFNIFFVLIVITIFQCNTLYIYSNNNFIIF